MSDQSLFSGPNAAFAEDLYAQYLQDPASVDPDTRALFDRLQPAPAAARPPQPVSAAALDAALATARLARFIRQRGHLTAHIDPLGITQTPDAGLDLNAHGLTESALAAVPSRVVGGPIAAQTQNALEAIERLRDVYSGSIGYEDEHIQDAEERYWLRDSAESRRFWQGFDVADKRDLLQRLTEVDVFEDYIQRIYAGEKRFSIEGTDMLVPMLDQIIEYAAAAGAREVVMGMSHRGRLNVLAHVLGKPYATILQEFKKNLSNGETASVAGGGSQGWLGDVKYHLGYRRSFSDSGVAEMPLTLVPNPSHLEYVNPVAEGHARAAQEQREQPGPPIQDTRTALPILIHGDAAFPGQGIVAETLNLSRLPGYRTGGTIHIIINNQIGFTTSPEEGRSTLYASDLAKGFEIPVVHVSADDPPACLAAARMAHAYRERWGKDFLIDLIGYRRYGHNEQDEPRSTQPRMYAAIEAHPRVREIWGERLIREGIVTAQEAEALAQEARARMRAANEAAAHAEPRTAEALPEGSRAAAPATAVPAEELQALNEALLARPPGFHPNADLERRFFGPRRAALTQPESILWAHAEILALASILADGTPIRMTGQDTERGTFSQRQIVLHDTQTGERYNPLQHLPQARASFGIHNSPLSENAAMAFEYGYSVHAPDALVLWEAQFGDFANGAQVVIDQFLASGQAKWQQHAALVLLLPHGYEGQGAEHSSARLERFLQLAATDNIRVANCSTAAQYFHILRRQAALLKRDPRPLALMTPKSLLRDRLAASSLPDLSAGRFEPVLDDLDARHKPDRITRVILCSGKIAINLLAWEKEQQTPGRERIAIVRVEQLYPLPANELKAVLHGYPNVAELVWMQEEPANMGAWSFMAPRLSALLAEAHISPAPLRYVGRGEAASPASGSRPQHMAEQQRIFDEALGAPPEAARRPELRIATH